MKPITRYQALFFVLFIGLILYSASISAKDILVGSNKGKEVLSQTETIMQNTAVLKAAMDESLKVQKETNDLLKKIIELQAGQQQQMNKLIESSSNAPQPAKSAASASAEGAPKKTSSSESFLKLQQETNGLLQKLIEEQRWQNTLLQSSLENKVILGGHSGGTPPKQ